MKPILEKCNNCGCKIIKGVLIKNGGVCNNCSSVEKILIIDNKDYKIRKIETISIIMPPIHSASFLVHKRNINYNSIKNGTKTIQYGNGYILKEDVINLFIGQLKKTS